MMKILLISLLACAMTPYQDKTVTAPQCTAELVASKADGLTTITGYCSSLSSQTQRYTYTLELAKQGAGGQSSNRQQGGFELAPSQTVRLSQISIGADAGTRFKGRLRILDANGQLVAQDSIAQ
ncbi:hypothetical protein KBK19_14985 [Microvirga sp. STR05]|uniref:CsgH-like domain-containing protein n=1 Tax=Hymenobacter duratus TaxID=2771356 RepID=A0ABR8JL73_9BACT|nr:curli-like amyloid fiber formation chaperone CsgH [Hymenobacter duratus]MBD2716343.1 hypothetical protein [Hymenobacter duratus]MBR7951258.1 hypothetical protein [Microvirga sp. STR05]